MKKLIAALVLTASTAGAAWATQYTIELEDADGVKTVVINDETKTMTKGDATTPYTYDEETMTLCSVGEAQEHCIAFTEKLEEAGESTTFTATDGSSGAATLISATE